MATAYLQLLALGLCIAALLHAYMRADYRAMERASFARRFNEYDGASLARDAWKGAL